MSESSMEEWRQSIQDGVISPNHARRLADRDLLIALRSMGSYGHKPYPTHFINPHGPQAADRIEELLGEKEAEAKSFEVGDKVFKLKGYEFRGTVVMKGETLAGKVRYVVDDGQGMLHIYSGSQLELQFTDDKPIEI